MDDNNNMALQLTPNQMAAEIVKLRAEAKQMQERIDAVNMFICGWCSYAEKRKIGFPPCAKI